MTDEVYKLMPEDIPKAGAMLARAFEHDPIWAYVMDSCTTKQRNAWFESPVRYCMHYGGAASYSPDIEGFIGWLPSEYSVMTFRRTLKSGMFKSGRKAGFAPMFRMAPLRVFDEDRKKHMAGRDFIYVMIVGVGPEFQGQGVGSRLIRHVIGESEKKGLPIYLETSTEGNVSMYKHYGFKILDKINIEKLNLPQWEMLREPANPSP